MMDEKISELRSFMREKKDMTQKKIDELVRDNRRDEARAYRAALNVYDIMEILLDTAKKTVNHDEICFQEEFHRLAAKVSAGWKVSLEKAKKHEDYEKIMIEEAKLGVVDSVMGKLNTLFWGGRNERSGSNFAV